MIEFSGVPSKECKKEIVMRASQSAKKVFLIGVPPIILLGLLMCFVFKYSEFYILTPLLIIVFLCCLYQLSHFPKNIEQMPMRRNVIINDTYVIDELSKAKTKIEAVKKILKTEHCYYIFYSIWHEEIECPRETLIQGTEEEFEMLFQGKIKSILFENMYKA